MYKSLIFVVIVCFGLNSCGPRCGRDWKFETPFTIENERIAYSVNDTIRISSYLDQKLKDVKSGERREFMDFGKHQMGITIVELDSVNAIYAQDKMTLLSIQGKYEFIGYADDKVSGNSGLYAINFEDNPPMYEAKFGIVVNHPGIYFFQIFSIAWTFNDKPIQMSECYDYFDGLEVKFSNDSDFNFDLFEPLPKPDYYPTVLEEYVNEGFFTFRVEE